MTDTQTTDRAVIGWAVPAAERDRLLERFPPRYPRTVADHVTLRASVPVETPPPEAAIGKIIGEADDGSGVQALIVEVDGETIRPDGGTFHITWSLGPTRTARQSNDVIAERGWARLEDPDTVRLEPARFLG